MAHPPPPPSPLERIHQQADPAPLVGLYGSPDQATPPIEVVQAFDPIEVEYAAIRRHAAIFDQPHRGVVEFRGPDRISFLNRMLTQSLADLPLGRSRNSFLLDRKGRIAADLRIVNLPDRALALGDVFAAARARESLEKYVITEDVAIADLSQSHHSFTLHGPAVFAVMAAAFGAATGVTPEVLLSSTAVEVELGGARVVVDRQDIAGEIGLELIVPAAQAAKLYESLSTPWSARKPTDAAAPQTSLARRIGWHALNIARIEAGTPMYMLDFGPDSLPHETGDATLHDRVSFKKGCYLGQEIVARMQSLGHPKQKLVGLRVQAPAGASAKLEPQTGTAVSDTDQPDATAIGAVTSAAFSPMNGGAAVCFAMVKYAYAVAGKMLYLHTGAEPVAAVVQPGLAFLPSR